MEKSEARKSLESGRVIFEEPLNLSIEQERKSSIAFDEKMRKKSEDNHEIFDEIIGKNEDAIKSSSTLSKNLERQSKFRLSDVGHYDDQTKDEIESRRKTLFASHNDLSRDSSEFLKIDENVIESNDEREGSTSLPTTDLSGKISSQMKLSCNIPVRSMAVDFPRTVHLSAEEAEAYCCILGRGLHQLELIKYRIPADVNEEWDESFRTLEEKYDVAEEPKYSLREYLGLEPLVPSVSKKLQRDRTYIYNILKELMKELRESGRYETLEREIDNIVRTIEDERSLEISNEIWREQVEQLNDLIESEKIEKEIEIKKWCNGVHETAADINDAIFFSNSKLNYVERWENTRLEGQKLRLEIKEQELHDELNEYDKKERIETIISNEIHAFLEYDINKIEEDYNLWMTRFNDEIEERQQDIDYLMEEIEKTEVIIKNNGTLLEERQEFIDNCVARREKIAEEKNYWDFVNGAATIIQSLWRGYIVRHQLGVYRGLWAALKKRKKLAAKKRKQLEARRIKMEAKKAAAEAALKKKGK